MEYILKDSTKECKEHCKGKRLIKEDKEDEIGYIELRDQRMIMKQIDTVQVFGNTQQYFELGVAVGLNKEMTFHSKPNKEIACLLSLTKKRRTKSSTNL